MLTRDSDSFRLSSAPSSDQLASDFARLTTAELLKKLLKNRKSDHSDSDFEDVHMFNEHQPPSYKESMLSRLLSEDELPVLDENLDFIFAEPKGAFQAPSPNSDSSDVEYAQLLPAKGCVSDLLRPSDLKQIERGTSVESGYQTSSNDGGNLRSPERDDEDMITQDDNDEEEENAMIMVPTSKLRWENYASIFVDL